MSKIKDTAINREIKASKVRLVSTEGEFIGIVSLEYALKQAEDANFDLVAVDTRSDIPVCKILDYGKMKYEMKRKHSRDRKATKKIIYKEIQINPHIDDHDYNKKMTDAKDFIEHDYRVKIVVRARGRVAATAMANIVHRILEDIKSFAKLESNIGDLTQRNIPISIIPK